MPVHSVELGHFILLNVNLEETGNSIFYNSNGTFFLTFTLVFKPSEFTIINTDGHSDFDIENTLTLRDQSDRKLDLKLNYVSVICMPCLRTPSDIQFQPSSRLRGSIQSSDICSLHSYQ